MSSLVVERGVQLPSVELAPDWVESDGEHALFLSSSYGLTADPWQERVVTSWLGRRHDRKWSAGRCGLAVPRQNGKNAVVEMRELYGIVALGERFLHTAHEVKTARKAFLRLASFFENSRMYPELAGLVRDIRKTNGQEAIVLHNGGSVEFVARSKSSGRGFSVDVLVLDEAQEASEEALAALLPTISASRNPQTILTGTPPGPTANGEVFCRVRRAGHEQSERRLSWMEWSCPEDCDPDNIDLWARANPGLHNRLLLETVQDERAIMDEDTFRRERMGVWEKDEANSVIDMAAWSKLDTGLEPDRPTPVAISVEVSPDRKWSNIGLAGIRSDTARHVQIVQSGRGTDWVPARLAELNAEWSPVAVALDPAGPAGSLVSDIESLGVEVMQLTPRQMSQATGMFRDAVAARTIRHSSQQLLSIAVRDAKLRQAGDSKVWDHRHSSTDISPLRATTIALYALANPPEKKQRSGTVW